MQDIYGRTITKTETKESVVYETAGIRIEYPKDVTDEQALLTFAALAPAGYEP